MKAASIDLETLGTNVDSQITQIGAVIFDLSTGEIVDCYSATIALAPDAHINATPATLKFWLQEVSTRPEMIDIAMPFNGVTLESALYDLTIFFDDHFIDEGVWANGTKFDLGMLEYQYKALNMPVPWMHNADRCMRTLRALNPQHKESCIFANKEAESYGRGAHDALSDAVWQAKYISHALNSMHEHGLNIFK